MPEEQCSEKQGNGARESGRRCEGGLNDWLRGTAWPFEEVVQLEQRRSERYNHYFTVALLSSARLAMSDLLHPVALRARGSDILGLVDPEGRYHPIGPDRERAMGAEGLGRLHDNWRLGIIFPETDRGEAAAALRRIMSSFTVEDGVSARCAVYPDDGTSPKDLVSIAAG